MQAWDFDAQREYRWIHPDYLEAYRKEAKSRGIKRRKSIDDRKYIDLEVAEDILGKSRSIFLGEEYDTRVIVPLDLEDDLLFQLMKLAHEADMTLNDFVAYILRQEIDKAKNASN